MIEESHTSPLSARQMRMCVKELREILRDRRTIVTLVLMPLLVYPVLSMAFQKFAMSSLSGLSEVECHVGVESEQDGNRLSHFLNVGQSLLTEPESTEDESTNAAVALPRLMEAPPLIRLVVASDLRDKVSAGILDVAVIMLEGEELDEASGFRRQLRCELIYREESALSKVAMQHLEKRLRIINERFAANVLQVRLPTEVRLESVRGSSGGAAFSLTTLVPLILILMTITGAVYPAIDLTAGERERGTLETLMAAPVPRLGLLLAKYVAVLTVALFTATANLVAMTVTLVATGLGETVFGSGGLTTQLVAQVFALLILFAGFFSAILLAVTSFARSFKEAQAYLIPLMLLSLAPGMMSLMPDLKFNGLLAVTPLVNIVLLARDIFEGQVNAPLAWVAVVSTGLYAFAAIGLAARIFGTDAILYGSQATWTDLLRRSDERREVATIPGALFCLAILFPLYFLLANGLQRIPEQSMTMRLVLSAVVTVGLFALLPVAAAKFQRATLSSAFQLRAVSPLSLIAAVGLGLAVWPFAHEVFLLNEWLGIHTLDADRLKGVEELLAAWRELSPVLILLTLAVTPAVCEELFFRGYLMGALRRSLRPWQAVLISALLFGIFHVIATNGLAVERFLPSTCMGLLLGWVCLRTHSVIPGIVLHTCHNGLLLMIAYYRDGLAARGWGVAEQTHLPAMWLLAATVITGVALAVLICVTRQRAVLVEPGQ